jgi:hypothetical protein
LKFIEDNFKENTDIKETSDPKKQGTKTINIPANFYRENSVLVNKIMDRLKLKFGLTSYFVLNESAIQIIGPVGVLDQVCSLVKKPASCVETKAIEGINSEILSCANLKDIIKDSLAECYGLIYKIDVKNDLKQGRRGVFITYCKDMPELDSPDDSVFDEVSRKVVSNVAFIEIDLTSQSTVLLSPEWKTFVEENLSEKVCSYNLAYKLSMWNLNGKIHLLLVGKRDFVMNAKEKVESFLAAYKSSGTSIDLSEEDVSLFLAFYGIRNIKHN